MRYSYPLARSLAGLVAIGALAATAPAPLAAQRSVSTSTRAEVARAAAAILEQNYVDPAVGRELASLLRRGAETDAWSGSADPRTFADALTRDLNDVAHDLHLRVVPPAGGRQAPGPGRRVVRVAPGEEPSGAGDPSEPGRRVVRRSAPAPADGAPSEPEPRRPPVDSSRDLPSSYRIQLPDDADPGTRDRMMAGIRARVAEERRQNHFFREAEVLRGNVGYLALDQFPIMPDAIPAADASMMFLAEVDAFILDLRGNPGGGEGMNQYLSSFFFADSVPLYHRYYRPDDETREYWSRPELVPIHLPDVPLYVLIDRGSGSAAENMAFSLRNAGRATLVGETTAGAGHSSTRMDLPGGFAIQVPIARVYDPRSGRGFEGSGVEPDVAVPAAEAAAAAHLAAIRDLLARVDDPARIDALERVAMLIEAHSLPPLTPDQLAEYAGDYGNRRIRVAEDALLLQRTDVPGAPELVLLHTGDDAFVLARDTSVRVRFTRDDRGAVRSVRVLNPFGEWEESERR